MLELKNTTITNIVDWLKLGNWLEKNTDVVWRDGLKPTELFLFTEDLKNTQLDISEDSKLSYNNHFSLYGYYLPDSIKYTQAEFEAKYMNL